MGGGLSHYIEVAQGTIFMEQNMRFGLILGWLAILKFTLGFSYTPAEWRELTTFWGTLQIRI